MPLKIFSAGIALTGCCCSCRSSLPPADQPPPETVTFYTCHVLEKFPHDPEAFTQGLAVYDGSLYEGTGLRGASSIRKVALETGAVLQIQKLPDAYFGEGIAVQNGRLVQLTWKSQVGFVYEKDSFERVRDFNYLGEGWGLTHDGERFIMSDGTARLRFLDINTLETVGEIYVRYGDEPVRYLNELEYIDGYIYANIWRKDRIAIINPQSGYVEGWVDMAGLLTAQERRNADVLNGIAYDEEDSRIFVTGKRWPKLFEIELVEERQEAYPVVRDMGNTK
ncbi:MAG: glutaminyl-peptide cyclotransferase [Candidatus Hydrogenedentes bacterium]|nr:glutaminyl-peptide cyclotransferase [Candidatus Hydrogenedentota bacterium]